MDIRQALNEMRKLNKRHQLLESENKKIMLELEKKFKEIVTNLSNFEKFIINTETHRIEWNGYVKFDKYIHWEIIFENGKATVFTDFTDGQIRNNKSMFKTPVELTRENIEFLVKIYEFSQMEFSEIVKKEIG